MSIENGTFEVPFLFHGLDRIGFFFSHLQIPYKLFRKFTELFVKTFREIRGCIESDHIADFVYFVFSTC